MEKQYRKQLRKQILQSCKQYSQERREWIVADELNINRIFYGNGLRLRKLGHQILSKLYTAYSFPAEKDWTRRTKTLIQLDNSMKFPYYIDTKQITLFEEEASVWLKMYGDADTWLNIFSEN